MIERLYHKLCNAEKLTGDIIAAGLAQSLEGGRFYGVSIFVDPADPLTVVYCYDDLTEAEGLIIDGVVEAQ
jgi:hypothetical protein